MIIEWLDIWPRGTKGAIMCQTSCFIVTSSTRRATAAAARPAEGINEMLGVSISFNSNYLIMLKIEKYISLLTYLQIMNKKKFPFCHKLRSTSRNPKKVLL